MMEGLWGFLFGVFCFWLLFWLLDGLAWLLVAGWRGFWYQVYRWQMRRAGCVPLNYDSWLDQLDWDRWQGWVDEFHAEADDVAAGSG
jgi:hypothetical protein